MDGGRRRKHPRSGVEEREAGERRCRTEGLGELRVERRRIRLFAAFFLADYLLLPATMKMVGPAKVLIQAQKLSSDHGLKWAKGDPLAHFSLELLILSNWLLRTHLSFRLATLTFAEPD